MTWGVLRPAVLLPAYTMDWTESRRSMLVRHEQAHVERHDWLWQMVTQVVCAAMWFNPCVWLAARQLRRECERAADDRVLSAGCDAPAYAAELLAIARAMQKPALSAGVAMAARGSLEGRVRNILDPGRRHMSTRRILHAALIVAVLVVGVPVAAIQSGLAYHVGDAGLTPPTPTKITKPSYTRDAMRQRIEGVVKLSAVVTEDGVAEDISVVESLDDGLDANAIESLSGWRFKPGSVVGMPVRVEVTVDVEYRIAALDRAYCDVSPFLNPAASASRSTLFPRR